MAPLLLVTKNNTWFLFLIRHCPLTLLLRLSFVFRFNILGNASQVSDGAGAVLLMRRDVAMAKGLPVLGVYRLVSISITNSVPVLAAGMDT